MKTIMTVFGTRPEAIKVAPVISALESASDFTSISVSTGQHREMLDQVLTLFGIHPDLDLNIIKPSQTLVDISVNTLMGVAEAIEIHKPDGVIVQGDTTTATFAALAAFYARVPIFHIEAGLRTGDLYAPFPEEANRKITAQLAALHLAPTPRSKANLLSEGIPSNQILVTGNTVIDSLLATTRLRHRFENEGLESFMREVSGAPLLLVTAHRRENLTSMKNIGAALSELATRYPSLRVVAPLHKNPLVRDALLPWFKGRDNIYAPEPLSYPDFVNATKLSHVVLTDSGGVQEEAPSLGKPVLVMRDKTERPEAVEAGTVKLVGTQTSSIVSNVAALLEDSELYSAMSAASNPYGDGNAASRIVAALKKHFGLSHELEEFQP